LAAYLRYKAAKTTPPYKGFGESASWLETQILFFALVLNSIFLNIVLMQKKIC
jgi:hypothetical protein